MRIRVLATAMLASLLVAGTLGCQRIAERAVEETTGVRVEEDGERVTVTGDDGDEYTLESEGGSLPRDWPNDVPVYPEADIASSSSIKSGGETVFSVTLTSDKPFDEAAEWYLDALESGGWNIDNQFEMESDGARSGNYNASKDDLQVWVWVTEEDAQLALTMQVQQAAE